MIASALAILAAYLIGGIPFGLLIARWVAGIDIRTVGSGNIGATNVGRGLGFRFFAVVFLLDMLKGLVPTFALPRLVERLAGVKPGWLPVLVALATILGHNFPVYLRFRGGKGVATSFGALLALDPVAMLAAVVAFLVVLAAARYVSLASVVGGVALAAAHFARVDAPWGRAQMPMSLLTLALAALLVVRHRANFARIAAGNEPKVSLGKKPPSPSARASLLALS